MTRYSIAEDVLCQEFPDEAVLLSLASAEYFRLNGTGLAVWRLLRAGADRGAIEASLLRDYEATGDEVRAEVDRFLGRMVELGLLRAEGAMTRLLRGAARWARLAALTAEAWVQLTRAAFVVRRAAACRRALGDALRAGPGGGAPAAPGDVARAVQRASRLHVRTKHCLEKSLAACWMLRRRGFAGRVAIGCRKRGGAIEFHAWVVDGAGAVVAGNGDESSYAALEPGSPAPLPGPPPP